MMISACAIWPKSLLARKRPVLSIARTLVDQTSFGMIQTQKTMLMEPQTFSGRRTAQDFERPGRQVMRFHQ
jgi:hypothetical protein